MARKNDWDPNWIDYSLSFLLFVAVMALAATILVLPVHAQGFPPAPPPNPHLDVPVTPPVLGGEPWAPITPDNDDGDDPSDTPPPTFYGEEIPTAKETIVYVLDRSGSMGRRPAEGAPTRWERAREETIRSVEGLSEDFEFTIILYANLIQDIFQKLVPADDRHKSAAKMALHKRPGGGTATAPATSRALLRYPENTTIILLTDGAPNSGTERCPKIIRNNNHQGAQIHCFGIEAYGPFRAMLQRIAAESGASYRDAY
jgi:uncharacterized protein with von Willebrand factor type A (vWA) domain